MSTAQWLVLALLLATAVLEWFVQPASRGFWIRLFHTLNPSAVAAATVNAGA